MITVLEMGISAGLSAVPSTRHRALTGSSAAPCVHLNHSPSVSAPEETVLLLRASTFLNFYFQVKYLQTNPPSVTATGTPTVTGMLFGQHLSSVRSPRTSLQPGRPKSCPGQRVAPAPFSEFALFVICLREPSQPFLSSRGCTWTWHRS